MDEKMILVEEKCCACGKTIMVTEASKQASDRAREKGWDPGIYCGYDCAMKVTDPDIEGDKPNETA
jgi:hypothetical protein